MDEGYARSRFTGGPEPGGIVALDLPSRTATVYIRARYTVQVNCAYAVGETIVTPKIGEQWYVQRFDNEWRLAGRIPFNDPTLNEEPVEGQVSVGSASGPLVLNGTGVQLRAPLVLPSYATADRPDAEEAGVGACVYDEDLHKLVISDGVVWRDALGTAV